ncbi:DUF6368 family protein [Streptomyces lavendulocolor]|uniref:DUF6368 family protein n=1 Tax=Streptomyces lavendulocolor TaxID=67316 RepID=UPI0031E0408E
MGGGPVAGLWLVEERGALDALPWLEGFCDVRAGAGDGEWLEIHVRRPSALGLHALPHPAPGAFHLGPESLEDYRELGFPGLDRPPVAQLALLSPRSGRENHLLLGHLALFLAERFDALVDFEGLLGRPSSPDDLPVEEEAARLAEARRLVSSLPGRVWEMPYATYGGGCWYSHVGDRTFLAAWLRHPDFRMLP